MKSKPVFICCSNCNGCGKVELTGEHLETYLLLRDLGTESTGSALSQRMGTKPSAMNNRLARLEEMGLATSRRWGKKRLFKCVVPNRSV
jgi:DNA-binding MarR family transcriptional regulator